MCGVELWSPGGGEGWRGLGRGWRGLGRGWRNGKVGGVSGGKEREWREGERMGDGMGGVWGV